MGGFRRARWNEFGAILPLAAYRLRAARPGAEGFGCALGAPAGHHASAGRYGLSVAAAVGFTERGSVSRRVSAALRAATLSVDRIGVEETIERRSTDAEQLRCPHFVAARFVQRVPHGLDGELEVAALLSCSDRRIGGVEAR